MKKFLVILILLIACPAWGATYCVKPDGGCAFANRSNATVADEAACTAVSVTTCTGAGSALSPAGAAGAFSAGDIVYFSGKNSAGADTDYTSEITIGASGVSNVSRVTYQGIADTTGSLYPRITNTAGSGYGGGVMVGGKSYFTFQKFRIAVTNTVTPSRAIYFRSAQSDYATLSDIVIDMSGASGASTSGIYSNIVMTHPDFNNITISGCKTNSIALVGTSSSAFSASNITTTAGGTSEFSVLTNVNTGTISNWTLSGNGSTSQSLIFNGISGLWAINGITTSSTHSVKFYNSALTDSSYVDTFTGTNNLSDDIQINNSSNLKIISAYATGGVGALVSTTNGSHNIDIIDSHAIECGSGFAINHGAYDVTVYNSSASGCSSKCALVENASHDVTFEQVVCANNGTVGSQNGGIVVHDTSYNINIMYSLFRDNVGYGIGIHNTTHGWIYNNTFYKNGWISGGNYDGDISVGLIAVNPTTLSNWTIKNNISYQGKPNLRLSISGDALIVSDYNILYPFDVNKVAYVGSTDYSFTGLQGLGYDTNSLDSDPLFVSNGVNFHLQSGSPARGAGVNVGLSNTNPPDIGAEPYTQYVPWMK